MQIANQISVMKELLRRLYRRIGVTDRDDVAGKYGKGRE
jgi:hypothetical protein